MRLNFLYDYVHHSGEECVSFKRMSLNLYEQLQRLGIRSDIRYPDDQPVACVEAA